MAGISHQTADVATRERLAVPTSELAGLLQRIGGEAAIINTCNRVELYTTAYADAVKLLCELRGVDRADFEGVLIQHDGRAAAEHLFRVAASLESMVPGEPQILGQVKKAYQLATEAGTAGPTLHGLMQRAVACGKQVMTETTLAAGRQSVASIAAGYADEIFDSLADKTLLCVGAGKMTRLLLDYWQGDDRPGKLRVVNRDARKAERFASQYNGQGGPLDELDEALTQADIVVTSTGSREPLITADRLGPLLKLRKHRPLFMIDMALPRDIEPACGELTNVYAYDLDDLQNAADRTAKERQSAVGHAEQIVEANLSAYLSWHHGRSAGETIARLRRQADAIVAGEVERTLRRLPELGEAGSDELRKLANRIAGKLLHGPVSALRESAGEQQHAAYRHAVEKLYGLGKALDEQVDKLKP
ncbi:MAG: glutamyl-tRNA reductase [Planctomycetota bacterium]